MEIVTNDGLRRGLATIFGCLILIGCAATPPSAASSHVSLEDVRVTARGADTQGAFCADFALDATQAREFLSAARILSERELHDNFDFLPCYVRGTGKRNGVPVLWEIRAGGTATVRAEGQAAVLLGCKDCAQKFR